jgi:benzoate membrane transport protein
MLGLRLRAALPQPPSRLLPALTISISMTVFGIAVLSIPLALAATLQLSAGASASWIAALYGLPALASVALSVVCRQPLLVAWNVAGIALAGTFVGHASYAEVRGAVLVAGVLTMLVGWLGFSERLSRWLPAPILMAVIAGAVLPFVTGIFTAWSDAPLAIGGAFVAYIVGRRVLPLKATAALPAMIVGVLGAAATGNLHLSALHWAPPVLSPASPAFSWTATIAVAPVLAILLTVTSNLVSVAYLRGRGTGLRFGQSTRRPARRRWSGRSSG